MTPKITIHHLETSRSERLFWLLEELGLPYNVKVHYRRKDGSADASLRDVNALGKAPALELDGKLLTESGYIIHALLNHPDIPVPSSLEAKSSESSIFWNHFCEGSLMMFLQPARTVSLRKRFAVGQLAENEREGAKKFADIMIKYMVEGGNNAFGEAEKFLEEHENFSGSDKFGEGDVSFLTGCADAVQHGVPDQLRCWWWSVQDRAKD